MMSPLAVRVRKVVVARRPSPDLRALVGINKKAPL